MKRNNEEINDTPIDDLYWKIPEGIFMLLQMISTIGLCNKRPFNIINEQLFDNEEIL